NSHEADTRADIYSLGATLYFLLTGRTPFARATSVARKIISHQLHEPPPLRSFRPEVPEELAAVVARMLAKDPADRYQTPAEVAAALAPWAGDVPAGTASRWGESPAGTAASSRREM